VITVRDARESLPHLIQSTGEPFAFPSIIAVYWMARLARGKATVALGGDGADELFAGYSRYRVLDALPVLSADASSRVDRELLSERPDDPATQYRAILTDGLRDGLKRRLYSRSFIERLGGSFPANYLAEPFRALGGDRPRLFRALDLDRRFWLPDAQLVKVDVGAMESSIEVRSPFLDPRVVDFAARVPMEMKLGAGLEKRILREAARDLLPEGIVERKKQELAVPLESWLSTALRAEISETLTARESLERGYFEPGALKELVERWDRRDAYALWTLYMLERWHVAFEVTA
jgi:asparagine synthase (glutamine-hydrolysing)